MRLRLSIATHPTRLDLESEKVREEYLTIRDNISDLYYVVETANHSIDAPIAGVLMYPCGVFTDKRDLMRKFVEAVTFADSVSDLKEWPSMNEIDTYFEAADFVTREYKQAKVEGEEYPIL